MTKTPTSEIIKAAKDEVAAGQKIIDQVRQELQDQDERKQKQRDELHDKIDGHTFFNKPPSAQSIREKLAAATFTSLRFGHWVTAGLSLVELRQSFATTAEWAAYAAELPIDTGKIDRLIGMVAHRGAMAVCTKCGTQLRCTCECGAPYRPEVPWNDEPEPMPTRKIPAKTTALDRATAALKVDQTKSNRLIAKEIGVDKETVRKARQQFAANSPPLSPPLRQNGKNSRPSWRAMPAEGESDCDYNPEIEGAFPDMSGAERRRDAAEYQETESQRMARDYALTEEGTGAKRDEITKLRIKEVRRTIAAWKRVEEKLVALRRRQE